MLVPPPDLVALAAARHRRAVPRNRRVADKHRAAGNRSFPSGYPVFRSTDIDENAHIDAVARALKLARGPGHCARQGRRADLRVLAGPSDEDVAALPHIEGAWYVALEACTELGIDRREFVRHPDQGLVVDWLTRTTAAALAAPSASSLPDHLLQRYGIDLYRICLEHDRLPGALAQHLERLSWPARTARRRPSSAGHW